MLQCQLRIEPTQRRYAPADHDRLFELFGETHRWSETLRSMLWTHASVQVPAFASGHVVDLPVPCSFDFNIAATKYFYGLGRRRGAVVAAVQRNDLLSRRRRPAADGADPLEQGGNLPAAPAPLAGDDGALLPQQRLAAHRPGHVRPALPLQAPAAITQLGRHIAGLLAEQGRRCNEPCTCRAHRQSRAL